jgi:hypothetical protein
MNTQTVATSSDSDSSGPKFGMTIMYADVFRHWINSPETIKEKLTEYVSESRKVSGREYVIFVCERSLWDAIRSQVPLQESSNGFNKDGTPKETDPANDSYAALEGFPRTTWIIFYGPSSFNTGRDAKAA